MLNTPRISIWICSRIIILEYSPSFNWKHFRNTTKITAWKVSVFGVVLVCIFLHSYWIRTTITPVASLVSLCACVLGVLAYVPYVLTYSCNFHACCAQIFHLPLCFRVWCSYLSYWLYISTAKFQKSLHRKICMYCCMKYTFYLQSDWKRYLS